MRKRTKTRLKKAKVKKKAIPAMLERRKTPFSVADARKLGLSQPTLSRLVKAEQITRVARGLYLAPDTPIDPQDQDYAVACSKFGPKATIGGLTALFYHRLINQPPDRIWVVVSYQQKTVHPQYRCLRTKLSPNIGVEDHGSFKIATVERSIVEALHFATKIGLRTALQAARTAIAEKRTTDAKIAAMGRQLGLKKTIEKYWEAIVT